MYLLDTNTVIYFFKNTGNVARNLLSKPPCEISLASVVLYELEVGVAKSHNPPKAMQQLELLVSRCRILPFDRREAKAAALIRAELELKGTPIGPYDVLIAATALTNGALLVTANQKEFSRINGLHLQNWL
jgi:tRNA(fMet)-specific endonuclease VapC